MTMQRSSGILLHISSLPSPYGIGNLGKEAYRFADFLEKAGQKYWQILPTNPTGFGDSPYQALSAFAGNYYFIDPDWLVQRGWLPEKALQKDGWGEDASKTDFAVLFEKRTALLRQAYCGFRKAAPEDFAAFCAKERDWLEDYCLFRALKTEFQNRPWDEWEKPIRFREEKAMSHYRETLSEEVDFHRFLQYCFFTEWASLRGYLKEKGISVIGDIPIYVPFDSADVWSHPEGFQLNAARKPKVIAGCPPDAFNRSGQYWGHPIYDWDAMEQDGFSWWKARVGAAARLYDVIRIDHFRGIESYWSIPARNKTAKCGAWIPGPGKKLVDALTQTFPETQFIAEDLGFLTENVRELVRQSGFPGMKVLQFAFDGHMANEYLPHHYSENCICYSGSHDTDTLAHYLSTLPWQDDAFLHSYCGASGKEDLRLKLLEIGMQSRAVLFIAPMQDYLALDGSARMNEPGKALATNWRWRMLPGAATDRLAADIRQMTGQAGRLLP